LAIDGDDNYDILTTSRYQLSPGVNFHMILSIELFLTANHWVNCWRCDR